MKTITINIPTTIDEIKLFFAGKADKRKAHNIQVVRTLYKGILGEIKSEYWSKDISDYYRNTIENHIKDRLTKAILDLK